MKRCAPALGLLACVVLPAPAVALHRIVVGNERVGAELGVGTEALAALNVDERVFLSNHEGALDVYFKGDPKALNDALRRFAAIPAERREIILMPPPVKPLVYTVAIPYDWYLHLPAPRGRRVDGPANDVTTLTIYVPHPSPPAPADPKAVRKWIAELGSNDFKTRERAAKELAAVGRPATAALREALRGKPSAEARERIEKLLAADNREIRLDVLDLPAGVTVTGVDELLDRARTGKTASDRSVGLAMLVRHGAAAEVLVPVLEAMLKDDPERDARTSAAWTAGWLNAGGRPLLPLLRPLEKSKDQGLANTAHQAIDQIERAKAEPVPEAELTKRALIRKSIREFVEKQRAAGPR